MLAVDRAHFVTGKYSLPYEDCPQMIDYNVTISAPHMHAYCLEWAEKKLQPGAKVLDVGCGSGYLCAAFYEMCKPDCKIVGIEHIDGLCQFSVDNLRKDYEAQLGKEIIIVCGDGRLGYDK